MARSGTTVTSPLRRRQKARDIKVIDGREYRLVTTPPRDPNAPRLRPVYLELPLGTPRTAFPLNEWSFEGRIVLPPQRVTVREGRTPMARMILGYREHAGLSEKGRVRFRFAQVKLTAFGDLAVALLENYRQGDHVRAWGGFSSWIQRMGVAFCAVVQKVEMVERAVEVGDSSDGHERQSVDLTDTGAVVRAAIGTAVP